MTTKQMIIAAFLITVFVILGQNASEWEGRGCAPARAARLALTHGAPEWGEFCG